MPTDKPARMITKLTGTLRAKDAEIAQLSKLAQERIAALERSQAALNVAWKNALQLRERLTTIERRVTELDQLNVDATAALETMENERDALLSECTESRELVAKLDTGFSRVALALGLAPGDADVDTVVSLIEVHRESTRRVADLASQVVLVAEQRSALTKILDDVRDRMRRRDLDNERAVLNRKALVAAVPGRNSK
jgi:DNA repair exonuclease SbcCD ATPase subunit